MGTSKSGSGVPGSSPLLPDWAPPASPPPPEEEQQDTPDDTNEEEAQDRPTYESTADFQSVKSNFTKYVNKPSRSTFKTAIRSYIGKTGGVKKSTISAAAGIRTGRGYISFLNNLGSQGLSETLSQLGLTSHIGKSSEEVLAIIADKIAPVGSTNDEAIARAAVLIATEKLYGRLEEDGQDLATLDTLNEAHIKEVVIEYVSAYIFKKWVYEAGMALEKNKLSENKAIELEHQMKDLIKQEVKGGIEKANLKNFNLAQESGRDLVLEIFELAYTTLEE
ncbi:Qat anti-phage system associated protein QatB [Salegentibacter sp. T436]|jgi:hypothetical protein|uniref:Qat anti-phage system associated protein QatB n=1 Tax=Salegentibacter sp. T436 TaxID=1729720 RepID=UPI00094A39D2|nr:Qat anti-phage system associated protein QatB [Salegentibacter sp. T436]APS38607.1 hypothetical protein AO058_06770 [Salegentibacter sp. T436]|tara:strand:- start:2413 stop:3246 length:834 start_codon:yes stop_codon:yes gene_type:complete